METDEPVHLRWTGGNAGAGIPCNIWRDTPAASDPVSLNARSFQPAFASRLERHQNFLARVPCRCRVAKIFGRFPHRNAIIGGEGESMPQQVSFFQYIGAFLRSATLFPQKIFLRALY
jgi:hypothetical protein